MIDSGDTLRYGASWHALTRRELEIVALVAGGFSNKEVASKLGLTAGTVKCHLHSIFVKLGAKNRFDLVSILYSSRATG